jgi:large-conductance mechanosensitive channel
VLFLVIRGINRLTTKEAEEAEKAPPLSKTEELLTEIRDQLKSR